MPKKYIANERVRHSVTRRYYEAGEEIPVDHVPPAQLAALVDRGVLREVEVADPVRTARKEEVKDHA
jgi:hypothetical protein